MYLLAQHVRSEGGVGPLNDLHPSVEVIYRHIYIYTYIYTKHNTIYVYVPARAAR